MKEDPMPAMANAAAAAGPMVRAARRLMGWVRRIWEYYGGANLLLNLMAGTVVVGIVAMAAVFLAPLTPMTDAKVIIPADGKIEVDRDISDEFVVTRRICMRSAAWGSVTRTYIDNNGKGVEYRLATERPLFFPAGCHERTRRAQVPPALPPGVYLYRSSVEFCSKFRCEDAWAQDIQIVIKGRWPVKVPDRIDPLPEPF